MILTTPKAHEKYKGNSRKYKGKGFLDFRYLMNFYNCLDGGCNVEGLPELSTPILDYIKFDIYVIYNDMTYWTFVSYLTYDK